MSNRGSAKLKTLTTPSPPAISRADVASRLGVSPQAVGEWIAGRSTPDPKHMKAMEDVWGIPMRAWLEDVGDASEPKAVTDDE